MTRFNTGNNLNSLDERDFYDNCLSLDQAMNSTDPTWRDRFNVEKPTIDAALKSAGFMPAAFDFVTGGTLQPGDRNKAVYNPAPNGDNNWYRWNGVFPKEITANSQPNPKDENNWVPVLIKTGVIEREALRRTYLEVGLNLVDGSFEQGAVISSTTDVVLHEKTGKVFSGPVGIVTAGMNPTSGGFVDRSDKLKSAVMSIESVSGLCSTDTSALKFGDAVIVTRYHSKISAPLAQENYGGGTFIWSDINKSEHDGGITIDPTKIFPTNWGGEVGTADWFTPTNSGRGCFVRVSNGNLADIDNFGGFPDGSISSDAALDGVVKGALRQAGFRGMISFGDGDYSFNRAHFFNSIGLLNFKGKGDRSTILRYKGTDRVFITINGQYISFSDFFTTASTSGKVFIRNYNEGGTADCDVYFIRVHGNSFRYMHECVGRGSVNYDSSLSGGGVGTWTRVVSPDPYTPSPNPIIQTIETGMRRYASYNLQVDHGRSIFEFATSGPAATHMNEVTIEGVTGNQLGILIEGGYLNTVNIKTGALVASLNGGVIKCNLLKNANIDLTASTYYGESTVPVLANTCNVMIYVTTESETLTNDVLIDSLKLSGVFRGLSNRCIRTNGYVKDILISGLNLPDAYNYKASSNPIFVDVNGIQSGSGVVIGDVTLGCSSWDGGTFNWINRNLTAKIGNYTKNAVPVKPYHRNNGAFSMDNGLLSKQVTHDMARTPNDTSISISLAGAPSGIGKMWISAVSETTFTVTTDAAPSANVRCVWKIDNSVV